MRTSICRWASRSLGSARFRSLTSAVNAHVAGYLAALVLQRDVDQLDVACGDRRAGIVATRPPAPPPEQVLLCADHSARASSRSADSTPPHVSDARMPPKSPARSAVIRIRSIWTMRPSRLRA
jgi:hypothetical protein